MCSWRAASGFLRVFCVVVIFVLPVSSMAQMLTAPVRTVGGVVDYANVLTPQEKSELEIAAGQLARRIDTDFFIVTVDDRAGQWAQQRSHYAMVGRVFGDVGSAVEKHFGRPAPLTVLIVFKSSVVLHLKTNRKDIEDYLFFHSFYAGAKDALQRIRQPGERHASAAVRYLVDFETTLAAAGGADAPNNLEAKTDGVKLWMLQEWAVLGTRQVAQSQFLEPFYKVYCTILSAAASHLLVPGWVGFLILIGFSSLIFEVPGAAAERALGPKLGPFAGEALGIVALPHLVLLYAVAQADLENLLYISQNFGGELVTYLDWSSDIAAHSFNLPVDAIAIAACTVAGLDLYVNLCKFYPDDGGGGDRNAVPSKRLLAADKVFACVFSVCLTLPKVVWIISLLIWPGLIAVCFLTASLIRRFTDLYFTISRDRIAAPPLPVASAFNVVTFQRGGAV